MRALLLSIFTLFLACSSSSNGDEEGLTPGTPAPDFTLTSLAGETYTLSELEGKVVYIFFYGAECPHCRANGPVTETEIHQTFRSDTNFVALGLDTWNLSTSSNQAFRSVTGITYPLLLNARQTLVDFYGTSSAYDRSVVISSVGNIVYQGTGFVNTDFETVKNRISQELENL
ncbi:MAG: peroxiredoxin family protein [Balneolales bacterium]|nr:peroxiredoxin family protein [Balneolales bacterium]